MGFQEREKTALMSYRLAAPQLADDFDAFLQPRAAFVMRYAAGLELALELAADPDAIPKSRMGLVPADFGAIRAALRAACAGLPLVAVQEGGYCMEEIPAAAEAFVLS